MIDSNGYLEVAWLNHEHKIINSEIYKSRIIERHVINRPEFQSTRFWRIVGILTRQLTNSFNSTDNKFLEGKKHQYIEMAFKIPRSQSYRKRLVLVEASDWTKKIQAKGSNWRLEGDRLAHRTTRIPGGECRACCPANRLFRKRLKECIESKGYMLDYWFWCGKNGMTFVTP